MRIVVQRLLDESARAVSWVAEVLGLHRSTVTRWLKGEPAGRRVGRPRKPVSLDLCFRVCSEIDRNAGRISVSRLRKLFPEASRAWLREVMARSARRRAQRRRHHQALLEWRRPGAVWAMDFTALEGRGGPIVMSVRDLAARKDLCAIEVLAESSEAVVTVLRGLFEEHGAPLVLKSDNGAAFRARDTRELLEAHRVLLLLSPPGTPSYNGACESGLGVMKRVAADLCAAHAPGGNVADYLEAAVGVLGSTTSRPGADAPTRDEVWVSRRRVSAGLRRRLHRSYRRHLQAHRESDGIAPDAELTDDQQASLDRRAIRDALCDLNLLTIQRP